MTLHSNEILFDNILDENIKGIFLSLSIMQWFVLLPKYSIYENFIVFNRPIVDVLSSVTFLIPIGSMIYRAFTKEQSSVYFSFIYITDIIFFGPGFFFSYIINLAYRGLNIELVLNIQRVFKKIKSNRSAQVQNNFAFWSFFVAILLFYAIYIYMNIHFSSRKWVELVVAISYIHYDINIIHACQVVRIITNLLKLWNRDLKIILEPIYNRVIETVDTNVCISENNQNFAKSKYHTKDETRKDLENYFELYKKILETYDIFKKLFQCAVLFQGLETFYNSLVCVQYWMEIDNGFGMDLKIDKINKDCLKTLLCAWILKDFIVTLVLSFMCQAFYTAIGDAEAYCLHQLAFNKHPDVKRLCKNILRLNRVAFRKMHAYGLYLLDPKLLLSVISSITAYAVVIIQFELIK